MRSVRCYGETKFFRQCPRYVLTSDETSFCWEHEDQHLVREEEVNFRKTYKNFNEEWQPLGAFLSNIEGTYVQTPAAPADEDRLLSSPPNNRLRDIAGDDQNVHTFEVQSTVNIAIKRLQFWALTNKIRVFRDLSSEISLSIENAREVEESALKHLSYCYEWNDDTLMFNVTYPQLASWVWARVNKPHENRMILRERFFEEVADSVGQCLNGNMSRLINVFAGIDDEIYPMDSDILMGDQLQELISRAVATKSLPDALNEVRKLLLRSNCSEAERESWLESVKDSY